MILVLFSTDSDEELSLLQRLCKEEGAYDAVICSHWAHGSTGAAALAEAVTKAAECPSSFRYKFSYEPHRTHFFIHMFRYLYDLEQSIEEKIEIIAKEVYGAAGIDISPAAQAQIDRYKAQVCYPLSRNGAFLIVFDIRALTTCQFAWPKRISRSPTIRP